MALKEGLSQNEREFQRTFFAMSEMVKVLYDDYLEKKRSVQGESSKKDKSEEGEDPPKTPPSSPSSSSSSSSTSSNSTARKHSHKHKLDMSLLKLDVKIVFPMYDGEVNAKKLGNWVRQMEVYCNVQKIKYEATKIRLASLHIEGVIAQFVARSNG
jgi:hypothetical protein